MTGASAYENAMQALSEAVRLPLSDTTKLHGLTAGSIARIMAWLYVAGRREAFEEVEGPWAVHGGDPKFLDVIRELAAKEL